MIESLKSLFGTGLSNVLSIFFVFVLLLIFRGEVRKLVNWITSFKRLAKTKAGYSIEGMSSPEVSKDYGETEGTLKKTLPVETKNTKTETDDENWITYFFEKEYDKALNILEKNISETEDQAKKISLKSLKGRVIFGKDLAKGEKYFEKLINSWPKYADPVNWFAVSYYWNDSYDKCLEIIEKGMHAVEDKSSLFFTKANCLSTMGNVEDAIQTLKYAIDNGFGSPSHFKLICHFFSKFKDKTSEARWNQKGLAEYPNDTDLLLGYATLLDEQQRYSEALFFYYKLVNVSPKNAKYYSNLGNAYLNNHLNDRALKSYEKANELAENKEAWIIANIGNLYLNKGFYSRAIDFLKQAIELNPDSDYSHNRLSKALKLQAEEDEKFDEILEGARHKHLKSIKTDALNSNNESNSA